MLTQADSEPSQSPLTTYGKMASFYITKHSEIVLPQGLKRFLFYLVADGGLLFYYL